MKALLRLARRLRRQDAMLRFGHMSSITESYRDKRRLTMLDALNNDLRFALRMLRKKRRHFHI